jgi:hypothetical protein
MIQHLDGLSREQALPGSPSLRVFVDPEIASLVLGALVFIVEDVVCW